ncbi:hypothetical protein FDI61_gp018 [Mycobacterium phage Marvin]|uniref:Uncharacterized protein n=3 Tax=Marvinvirus marvin TaxID=1982092 RepID=A0A3G8FEQ1_9CAUD|nr:hypothetical protein FDI61_gp018 [Mycobacterium phage Marvin]AEJ95302.1 hypothetical protein MARVIN_18 [Mycobacterium phage Marvin]AZF93288.1 hypothetical protein SEA_BEELZEBUB_23 [Mycobacterium phage Beelzebub]QFP94159.1 hypothetical protein SEA_JOIEB_20 [Mycobacterium phage JoieB]
MGVADKILITVVVAVLAAVGAAKCSEQGSASNIGGDTYTVE